MIGNQAGGVTHRCLGHLHVGGYLLDNFDPAHLEHLVRMSAYQAPNFLDATRLYGLAQRTFVGTITLPAIASGPLSAIQRMIRQSETVVPAQ